MVDRMVSAMGLPGRSGHLRQPPVPASGSHRFRRRTGCRSRSRPSPSRPIPRMEGPSGRIANDTWHSGRPRVLGRLDSLNNRNECFGHGNHPVTSDSGRCLAINHVDVARTLVLGSKALHLPLQREGAQGLEQRNRHNRRYPDPHRGTTCSCPDDSVSGPALVQQDPRILMIRGQADRLGSWLHVY